ncbi:unnamed protein product, partial [Mesorhabditis spiculigera]
MYLQIRECSKKDTIAFMRQLVDEWRQGLREIWRIHVWTDDSDRLFDRERLKRGDGDGDTLVMHDGASLVSLPKGKIWASNPSGCLPDHGHHYGWNVRGIDAINLLFAGRIVPTLYIEDPEFRCNSTRLPGLQALTLEVLGVSTLRMHWPKALKPEGRPFEAVQFRRFEAAAHCCLGSDVAQSIHILHPQSLNDCLILKNRNQRIQICEHLQEQRESYVQKVIAQWRVGKRDIQIVIASPRRPPSALSAEYERDDGQKILYRTTSNGYLIELDPSESDAVSLM